jgi:signal transduction histidine kinase
VHNHYYEISINPLFEKGTIYGGVILIFREITARKKSDVVLKNQADELVALNQLKDKMFSIIAHDLRGPIMNLKEIMSLFDKNIITDEELKTHLPLINADIKSTASLLENLLFWSRTQLKGERVNPEYINLHILSIVQTNLLESQIKEKDLSIINMIPESTTVYADKNMIELVIRNILSNAVKYCNKSNTITLSSRLAGNYYITEITDTGIGISDENIDKLFGMNNFSTAGTYAEKGTGLGLLLCKEFIEKNNGEIWVKSEIGKGSTFSFSLPIR